MRTVKHFLLFVLLSANLTVEAADYKALTHLFNATFRTSHYQEGRCGENIERLVSKAIDTKLDLSGAYILQITDISGRHFGMVNAVEARSHIPGGAPLERNWSHHVVLLVEGKVLDYDFTNVPLFLPLKNYLNTMFIPKEFRADAKYKKAKMNGYKLKYYPAEDYILRRRQRLSVEPISKEYYLKDVMPEFFQDF